MGSRFDSQPSRVAAPLLATSFVILGGALACTGVVLVFSPDPAVPLMIVGGIAVGLGLLAVLFRERPGGGSRSVMSWVFSRGARPAHMDYRPVLRKPRWQQYGTNAPPSLAEIRDLKDTDRNWVPSNTRAGRRSQKPDHGAQ
ncbi:hypothetical protein Mal4_23060 [Maioricimonas rarisocia]|uniref:Uncharacterized protein n=1 Tax=Maioricimonas rarisocia TaxID=2528026 RepID=A0A517Z680_9PLAN|nr:hypothetical protein [Maioricimonas rarisocia]QDU37987.1 hypothetical protein Mal4_23060 [Maioricimonas rarisocia]